MSATSAGASHPEKAIAEAKEPEAAAPAPLPQPNSSTGLRRSDRLTTRSQNNSAAPVPVPAQAPSKGHSQGSDDASGNAKGTVQTGRSAKKGKSPDSVRSTAATSENPPEDDEDDSLDPPPALDPADSVWKEYATGKTIYKGGFGIVYEAVHIASGDKVAIKQANVTHENTDEISFADRLREFQMLDIVKGHPNMLRWGGRDFSTMAWRFSLHGLNTITSLDSVRQLYMPFNIVLLPTPALHVDVLHYFLGAPQLYANITGMDAYLVTELANSDLKAFFATQEAKQEEVIKVMTIRRVFNAQ